MVRMSKTEMQTLFYQNAANGIIQYLKQELRLSPQQHYAIQVPFNGPRVLTLHLTINPRYANKIMGMATELSMAVGLDREYSVRIDRGRGGALAIEIPKPKIIWYDVSVTNFKPRRGMRAVIGIDNDKRVTTIDFEQPLTSHALIAGSTGSGKTNAQKLFVYDLAWQNEPDQVSFVLIDTRKRGVNWRPFAHLPHLAHPIITDETVALKVLTWGSAEIDRRSTSGQQRPRTFFFVDEAQALLERDEFIKPIADIAAVGREVGLHLILSTQDPNKKQLGDVAIKRNLGIRLVGRVHDPTAAYVATGQQKTGAEKLIGSGDMFLVQPGDMRRVATAHITDKDTRHLPRAEMTHHLDLDEYEDPAHVVDQADNQRKVRADPLDPAQFAYALAYPETSQRSMNERFSIGFPKIKRVQKLACDVLRELEKLGFCVCNGATAATDDDDWGA